MSLVSIEFEGAAGPVEVRLEAAPGEEAGWMHATVDGREVALVVEAAGSDRGRLRREGRVVSYRVVREGDVLHLWVQGTTHRARIVPRTARRAGHADAAAAANDLAAPMPGTILRVAVAEGDAFEAHQAIIVMESMKMEMTLSVPRPGVVREVLCAEGDLVEKGALLARLDGGEGS